MRDNAKYFRLNPVDRRLAAIRDLTEAFLVDGAHTLKAGFTATDLLAEINALKPLGRTQRWHTALDRWEDMVNEHPENPTWVIVQGSVFAAYAAL